MLWLVNEPNLKKHFLKCLKVGPKNGPNIYQNVNNYISLFLLKNILIILASEFGSMTSAWKAIMNEADATADVHHAVHDDLQNDVIPEIKTWQKGKYIKSMMHVKSTKEFEEEFKRVSIWTC